LSIIWLYFFILIFQLNFSKSIYSILSTAILFRLILIIIRVFIDLPDSNSDALSFYIKAYDLSQSIFSTILSSYPGAHSFL